MTPAPAPVPIPSARHRLLILMGLWAVVLTVLVVFRAVVLPFAGAALIAYLVAPLVDRMHKLKLGRYAVPRWAAITSIYALFFLTVYLAFIALVPQLYREVARISKDAAHTFTPARINAFATEADAWLQAKGIPVELSHRAVMGAEAEEAVDASGYGLRLDVELLIREGVAKGTQLIRENLGDIVSFSRSVIAATLAGVFMLFFILMVAAFISIDWISIRAYVQTLVPPEYAEDARYLLHRMDRSLAGVVRGQVAICIVNGVLTLIGLVIFGVKFAFLLATIAMVLSLIPIFGSILSSVPIVLIGLSQSFRTGVFALLWIVGIHALEAYLLNPKIMGTAARIHPVVVAFVLIAGERTFGLIGALFAVPVAAIFVAVFDYARVKAQAPGVTLKPFG